MKKPLVIASLIVAAALNASAEVKTVNAREAGEWLYRALPLPHEIKIDAKNVVAPTDIAIKIRPDAGDIEKNAKKTLEAFFQAKTGTVPRGDKFEIVLGVIDADGKLLGHPVKSAARLKTLPNNDQAYAIEPIGDNGLLVAALDPKGAFYGTATLRQLLSEDISAKAVAIPLANVVDWPDFAVRGLWNGGTYLMCQWLSEVKLNYAKNYSDVENLSSSGLSLDTRGKPIFNKINRDVVMNARNYAFNNAPAIFHLNFLPKFCPLYKTYPTLAGKGNEAIQKTNTPYPCPCATNPLLVTLLAGWLREYAKVGIHDVSVWTSEYRCYCDCDKCAAAVPDKETRQMVLETRAIVAAWREVQKDFPDFQTRVLGFPLAIDPACLNASGRWNAKAYALAIPAVMKEVPKGMIVEQVYPRYVCKNGKYSDAIDPFAAEGHKLVAYTAIPGGINGLYRSPAWLVNYLPGLLDRKWYGVCSWDNMDGRDIAFDRAIGAHGVYAMAEWSWNAKGRSLGEFFRAWATVEGLACPKNAATWGEIVSPLDLKITNFRYQCSTAKQMKSLLSTMKSDQKSSVAGYATALNEKNALAELEKAVELAKTLNKEQALLETRESLLIYRELYALAALENALKNAPEKTADRARELIDILKERKTLAASLLALLRNYRYGTFSHGGDFDGQIKTIEADLLGK